MKIELTLPALERLIGGDTEIEVALRRQIVEEFAKRHLKVVADEACYQTALQNAKHYVDEVAKETFDIENITTSHLWPTVGSRLQSLIRNLVEQQAQKIVDEVLMKTIEYQKKYWSDEVSRAVKKEIDRQIEREIEEGIRKRLEVASQLSGAGK